MRHRDQGVFSQLFDTLYLVVIPSRAYFPFRRRKVLSIVRHCAPRIFEGVLVPRKMENMFKTCSVFLILVSENSEQL
jgi:hypothetical protein